MKKAFILLAATIMLTALSATAQNQVDNQGRRQGHWIRTDKDGSKIFEGDFVDGLETGTFTYYYHNGTVRIRNTYTEPGRRCQHEAYDEQGHLLARGEYNQRNRDGLWRFYAEDGRLIKEASYKMGIKDGRHVVYEKNGDTAEVTHWTNNHRNGRWWKRIGDKGYITGTYVNGGLEGRLVEYNDEGLVVHEGYYADGLKHGGHTYFHNGEPVVKERWVNGNMNDRNILLPLAEGKRFESIYDIACMAAQGKSKTIVLLKNGSRLTVLETPDAIFDRAGDELFSLANRKSRVMVARDCIQGISKDNEGREILLLEPQPDFAIFPDEDAVKMVNALKYRDHPTLED